MIYILDRSPSESAAALADEDLIKTIPEIAATLCGAHVLINGEAATATLMGDSFISAYITSFVHWTASDYMVYDWMRVYLASCILHYETRLKRRHSYSVARLLQRPEGISSIGWMRPPPQSVPRSYRGRDAIDAYRRAYFDRSTGKYWSAPDSMPQWFATRLTDAIKELAK